MTYTIKQVSEKLNISAYTLRYYEKEKVIANITRDDYGNRLYGENDISWIETVKCLKETGMKLSDIKKIVELSCQEESDRNVPERREILLKHRDQVVKQIEDMKNSLSKIDIKIAFYDGKISKC
jgi:DNA-binding transcriptional MerR regulator